VNSTTGYKESKVGLIPTDWSVAVIGEVASLVANGFVGTATPYHTNDDVGITYLQGYNVRSNRIDLTNVTRVTREFSARQKKSILQEGDMLTVQSGHIGTSAIVPQELAGANCHAVIITRFFKDKVDPHFVAYYFNSTVGRSRLRVLEVGSSVLHILTKDLRKFRIPLPPLPEQRKITEILSTWDQAIALTERRIEAARQRKKGLMQCLLTGRVRFPEFAGEEWREAQLGEFFREFTKRNKSNEDLTVLSCSTIYGIVPQMQVFSRRIASENIERYKVVERGDLIYDPMLLWDASIGFLEVVERGVVSPAYSTFKFREENGVREYSKYLIKTHYLREHYKFISQGTNVRRRKAPVEAFLRLKVKVPSTKEEQEKIAAVLQACDREIDLLIQKRDALQRQKKGLMQRLLTGRVRVEV
jgi:type I restriction enzyme S subunit